MIGRIFKPGEKVIALETSRYLQAKNKLEIGKTYIVKDADQFGVHLKEKTLLYYPEYFKPIEETELEMLQTIGNRYGYPDQ